MNYSVKSVQEGQIVITVTSEPTKRGDKTDKTVTNHTVLQESQPVAPGVGTLA